MHHRPMISFAIVMSSREVISKISSILSFSSHTQFFVSVNLNMKEIGGSSKIEFLFWGKLS
jgi:hypothetical protein